MFELPELPDLTLASALLGALFLLRFALGVRRLREGSASARFGEDVRRATRPHAFGNEAEPDRRYAVRQLGLGLFFGLVACLLAFVLALRSYL